MEHHTEHIDDLAEGYALDALEPDERIRVEQHVAMCPPCLEQVQLLHDTAHLLGFVATPQAPPAHCKRRVLEKVGREEFLRTPTRRSRTPQAISIWAAVATVAFLMTGTWGMTLQRRVSDSAAAMASMQAQLASVQSERSAMQSQIAYFASTEAVRSLKAEGSGTGATAKTYMTPGKNEAVLVVSNLPQLAPGKMYQVWVARPGVQQPCAKFASTNSTLMIALQSPEPMETYQWIMLTVEDAAGAQQPSKNTVLFGDL